MNQYKGIQKVLWITLSWTLIALFQFMIGWGSLIEVAGGDIEFDPWIHFRGSLFTGLIAGIVGGSTLVFVWEKWLRTKPYGWTLRSMFLSYVITFFVVSVPTSVFHESALLGLTLWDQEVWQGVLVSHTRPSIFIPFVFWMMVVLSTLIVFLVNDKYGPGVFANFLMGKYFHPSREERIFMFLDLRASTTIAEQLGEEKYFEFLREVVKISTPGILRHQGEIYQYVGDEIVISWPMDHGISEMNCIHCFIDIKKDLLARSVYFDSRFGVRPEFKAGLHHGHVMAGEIGVVKRDIAYSGDVLNTASRIQGKCNELGVDILLSKSLIDKIPNVLSHFQIKEMGTIELRGKKQRVQLCTLPFPT